MGLECCGKLLFVVLIVIWLILPVVICLSQRLSHACLSSSKNKVKPRMAHYISYGSLDRTYYLDNCGNSRANTCNGFQPFGRNAFIRSKPIGLRVVLLVTLNNFADRMALCRRRIFQVSALSTVDGRLCAYHGCNG